MTSSSTATKGLVWVIDAEHWPRALLRAELLERGIEAVGHEEASHAISALRRPRTRRPGAIVLELRGALAERSAVQALLQTRVPVIATGGAVEFADPWVREQRWTAVVPRPVTIGELADSVEHLLAGKTSARSSL